MPPGKSRYQKPIEDIRKEIRKHFKFPLVDLLKIKHSKNVDLVFQKLESFIEQNVRGISSSQLRKLFDIVDDLEINQLKIQRPRIAHMIAKQPREEAKKMIILVDTLIAQMDDTNSNGFLYFLKCLLAFHKYYEVLDQRRMKLDGIKKEVEKGLKKVKISEVLKLHTPNSPVNKILDGLSAFLKQNAKGITSNKLRNVYSKILTTQGQTVMELKLLKPELAYTAARQARHESVKFIYLVLEMLKQVETEEDQVAFIKVMETIVSLHKFAEAENESKIDSVKDKVENKGNFGEDAANDLLEMISAPNYDAIQEKLQHLVLSKGAKNGLKSSQFRRLYDKAMEAQSIEEVQLLRPLFLYTAARQTDAKAQQLILFLADLTKQINEQQIAAFKRLISDLLAYHRYFEESNALNIIQLKK